MKIKVSHCQGEGAGSCKRCTDRGKWNQNWMCFLYKIDGLDGCYCRDCVEEIRKEMEASNMKLTDLMVNPLKDLVEQCNITKVNPISDDDGNIIKIIVEYVPHNDGLEVPTFLNNGGH